MGADALDEVGAGDTVEFRAELEAVPLHTLLRLFLWFADRAKRQGTLFSQKGEELETTKEAERNVRALLGGEDGGREVVVMARPLGDRGPSVAMPIDSEWLIGKLGRLGGEYTVVAQVDEIVEEGAELPTLRLTHEVAATPLEITALKEALNNFAEPAKALGVTVSAQDGVIVGRPVARSNRDLQVGAGPLSLGASGDSPGSRAPWSTRREAWLGCTSTSQPSDRRSRRRSNFDPIPSPVAVPLSGTSTEFKRQVSDQITSTEPLSDGAVALQIGFVVGPTRVWPNLWKPTIDALGRILGHDHGAREWNTRDGRITELALHCVVDHALRYGVGIAIQAAIADN